MAVVEKTKVEDVVVPAVWDFTRPSDLQLLVEDTPMLVHREILMSVSPVFKAMFESDFQERHSRVIALPGKTVAQLQVFLNFVYPFGHRVTDDTDIHSLLDLSREYQVQHVRGICETHLLARPPSLDLLLLAQEFSLDRLSDKCIQHVANVPSREIQKDPRFQTLSDWSKLSIMKHQLLSLQKHAKKIKDMVMAKDARYMPCISSVKCGHKPKHVKNPHYVCSSCKLSIMKSFMVNEGNRLEFIV